jgi:hypothetical protein
MGTLRSEDPETLATAPEGVLLEGVASRRFRAARV